MQARVNDLRWLGAVLLVLGILVFFGTVSRSQEKKAYTPTSEQAKDLRIAQLEAIPVVQAYNQRAQQIPEYTAWIMAAQKLPEFKQVQEQVAKIKAVCSTVEKDNKWPASVDCNYDANPITFAEKAGVEAPATPPKEAVKK